MQADADMAARQKRQDAWAVSWENLCLLILELTLPNYRGEFFLHETDLYKTARYKSLRDLLEQLLPGWNYRRTQLVSEARTIRTDGMHSCDDPK